MKKYYIVFERVHTKMWWHRLTGKEFAHCYAMFANGNQTVVINQSIRFMAVEVLDRHIGDVVAEIIANDATAIISYNAHYRYANIGLCKYLFTCVGVIKSLLNIESKAVTPKQLYKFLKLKGEVIWEAY
jgi:hypothetical protein